MQFPMTVSNAEEEKLWRKAASDIQKRLQFLRSNLMVQAATHSDRAFSQLLINRVSTQYDILAPTLYERIMAVLDYISGMTDVYALDLYRKINGMSLPAV